MDGYTKDQDYIDLYDGREAGTFFLFGENGDSTGSPYGTGYNVSKEKELGTVVKSQVMLEAEQRSESAQEAAAMANAEVAAQVQATGKPWYEVVALLGGTAAEVLAANNGTNLNSMNAAMVAAQNANYLNSLPAEEQRKRNMMNILYAVIIAVVLGILAFLAFRNKQN